MNSTALPSRYFGTHRQCFQPVSLTWPAYGDGRKREYRSVLKYRIILASTCRRSVQFGCNTIWLCMANCASVMTKVLPLYNFTIRRKRRKREYRYVLKYRIILASTCRRSVQFGCNTIWLWMANCASVMTTVLPLYNFIIPCRGRRAWKTSQYARAFAGSRFWLVESTIFGDHVSLRLHWEISLKLNFFN